MTPLPPLPEPTMFHPHSGNPLYTAEQVEAIRRETVEACAALCDELKEAWKAGASHMTASLIAAEIRALLEKQE